MKNFITIVLLLLILYLLWDNNKRETFQGQQENINTYIINLDQSKDRLELITKQCKREGLNCHRFSAVNGKKLDAKTMDIVETIQALGVSGVIGFILIIFGAFKAPVFTMAMMLFALDYNEWGVLMIIISIIKWFNTEDKKEDKND